MLEQLGYSFAATAQGGGGEETLTTLANIDLEANAINAIDLSEAVSTHLSGDGIATLESTGDALGGPAYRFQHATNSDAYSCFRNWDLASGNTFGFRRMAIRFEMQVGSTWGLESDPCKLMIVNMETTLGAGTTSRPMLYLDGSVGDNEDAFKPAGSAGLGLAQGTNKRYSPTATVDYMEGTTPFFFGETTGTWDGRPIVGADEWVSISYYMNSQAETDWPDGRLWMKVTRQNGTVLANYSFPFNLDPAAVANDYFSVLDVLGGYYNLAATTQSSTNYLKIAYPTFQANANAPLEPRTGFVS